MVEIPKRTLSFPEDVERWFETQQTELTLTTLKYLIVQLRGGQAVIIKALVGNTGNVYVGKSNVSTSNGFELSPGESLKVEYFPDKEPGEWLKLFAVCATAEDDVCYIIVP